MDGALSFVGNASKKLDKKRPNRVCYIRVMDWDTESISVDSMKKREKEFPFLVFCEKARADCADEGDMKEEKTKDALSDAERAAAAEDSIRKRFHRRLFTPFAKAISAYDLVREGDRIAVCISGGKDSMAMAKLFQELKRHNKFPFELRFLVMDPGYSPTHRALLERNAQLLRVPIEIFETDLFSNVYRIPKSPCYICARMRRGYLYHRAQELGCNKIALGHHYDDVIETILMGMLYGGQMQTMMPKLRSTNVSGMELIRPMYFVREADIEAWRDANGLRFLQCACRFTEESTIADSKRKKVKELIRSLKREDPQIEANLFKSAENVSLATVIAYKDKQGNRHHFLDDY